jgi:predicted component of type VI protein secretion system
VRGLVLLLLLVAGCTTVPPEQRESMQYERIDARLKATEKFNVLRAGCRAAGGIVVVEGNASRLPRAGVEMKTARCVERPPSVMF